MIMAKKGTTYRKAYYSENKEVFQRAANKWKKANRQKYLDSQNKYNKKRRNKNGS